MRQHIALVIACSLVSATVVRAAEIVDQQNPTAPFTNLNMSLTPVGQQIVPNHTAINFVDLRIEDAGSDIGPGCDFHVLVRSSSISGTILGTSSSVYVPDNQSGFYRFNFPTPVAVNPAQMYVIQPMKLSGGSGVANYMWTQGTTNGYAAGLPIIQGSVGNPNSSTNDFLFRTGRNTNTGAATSGSIAPFAYRGIVDSERDGDGDILQAAPYVARRGPPNVSDENRAVFEYDVDRYFGVVSAKVTGTLYVNNSNDTGDRIVRLDLFDGDGLITTSDFQISAVSVPETFSYHPPFESSVDFDIDITDQLNTLLESGADFLGVRFTPTNNQSPSVFTSSDRPMLNVVAPQSGDFDFDSDLDATDIDLLFATQQGAITPAREKFDVNFDDSINSTPNTTTSDADVWVRDLMDTEYGDINFDGDVNFNDLLVVAQNYNAVGGGWALGNVDGLPGVNFGDLLLMAQNYGFGAIEASGDFSSDDSNFSADFISDWSLAQSMIPEPAAIGVLSMLSVLVGRRRR